MRITHEQAINALLSGLEGTFGKRDRVIKDVRGNTCWLYHDSAIVTIEPSGAIYIDWHGYVKAPSTSQRIYSLYDYKGVPRPDREFKESRYRARALEAS